MAEPDYLNALQAAEYLGLTRQRIYSLSKAGKIGKQVAGFWLYTKPELDAWRASSNRRGGRPKASAGRWHRRAGRRDRSSTTTAPSPQLLAELAPEPETIAALCKRLRMQPTDLRDVIAQNRDALVERGMHLHVATASEVRSAIKLASLSNADEPTYYSRISKNLFGVTGD